MNGEQESHHIESSATPATPAGTWVITTLQALVGAVVYKSSACNICSQNSRSFFSLPRNQLPTCVQIKCSTPCPPLNSVTCHHAKKRIFLLYAMMPFGLPIAMLISWHA